MREERFLGDQPREAALWIERRRCLRSERAVFVDTESAGHEHPVAKRESLLEERAGVDLERRGLVGGRYCAGSDRRRAWRQNRRAGSIPGENTTEVLRAERRLRHD